jgi:hypothetical protein
MHEIEPSAGARILDFGIGTGGMARYLKSQGYWVCSVDISPLAQLRVSGISDMVTSFDKEYPNTDIGIAHLVFQHMCDEDIITALRNMHTSYLSVQFISGKQKDAELRYLRTTERMLNLIQSVYPRAECLWQGSEYWIKGFQNHVCRYANLGTGD